MAGDVGGITIDKVQLDKIIGKLGLKYRKVAEIVLFDQHRLYTEDLIKGTPPFKLKDGKTAINRDLGKIFIEIDQQQVLDFYAENFGKKPKSASKKVKASTRDLEAQNIVFNWTGNKGTARNFHKKYRTGKMKGVRFKSRDRVIGKFTFGTGMYMTKTKINAYKREVYKSIGKLKAGWVPAAKHFGSKIPAFVNKQKTQQGHFAQDFKKLRGSGWATSVNRIPWADKRLKQLMRFATKKRDKAMQKHLKRQVDIAMKKWSQNKNG
jgi:hypothetical protein